jgi:uncharacterized protein YjiS (DUF1127 family)
MKMSRPARPATLSPRTEPAFRPWRIAGLLRRWLHRARSRDELAQLSDAQIRDMGLNPEWVRREGAKPFWEI